MLRTASLTGSPSAPSETAHFSTWDCNWPYGFPGDAVDAIANVLGFGPKDCKRRVGSSIIGCEDQTLGEVLPVAGTPYRLHYQSERMPGRSDRYALFVGLSGAELPPSLKRIELEIEVYGQTFKQTFEPAANLAREWQWGGKDASEDLARRSTRGREGRLRVRQRLREHRSIWPSRQWHPDHWRSVAVRSIEDVFHRQPAHADYNGRQLLFEGLFVTAIGLAPFWIRFG